MGAWGVRRGRVGGGGGGGGGVKKGKGKIEEK